jgi:hypothetical protein
VTGSIDIGGVQRDPESPTPTPALSSDKSSSSSGSGDKLTRLLFLVVGGAVLLGGSGAVGLYVTRHRHDH